MSNRPSVMSQRSVVIPVAASAAVLALAAFLVLAASVNMPHYNEASGFCYNGGFEAEGEGFFQGWGRSASGGKLGEDVVIEPSSDAHGGRLAVRMKCTGKGSAILNPVPPFYMRVIQGRVRFWYRAVSSACKGKNLAVYIIPLLADGGEGGGARVAFTVPESHVADGRWHEAELGFDYQRDPAVVKTIVAPRINEGGPVGEGEWLIDDISAERGSYLLRPELVIRGLAAADGVVTGLPKTVTVTCNVENAGRVPADEVKVQVRASRLVGGDLTDTGAASLTIAGLGPQETKAVTLEYGVRESGWLVLEASAQGRYTDPDNGKRGLAPKVIAVSWAPVRKALAPSPTHGPSGKHGRRSLSIVGGAGMILLDREEEPPILRFFVRRGRWREVGRSPWLARIGCDGQKFATVVPELEQAEVRGGVLRLRLRTSSALSPSVGWQIDESFRYDSRLGAFEASCLAKPRGRARLRLLEFPVILVGEGATGVEKTSAIFPGLEFLKGGERSSSARDIRPPASDRWSPHPFAVTVPVMAVATTRGAVGLAWDPLDRWDGRRRFTTPVFASPNFLDSQANHKLALFVPSIPDFVPENGREAAKPVETDGPVTIRAKVILEPEGQALDLVTRWVGRLMKDWTLPPEPRSCDDELSLSARAFTETIWSDEAAGWEPVKSWDPTPDPGILLTVLRLSPLVKDSNLADRLRAVADNALRTHGERLSDLNLSFAAGRVFESLTALQRQAEAIMREQGPDGQWTFQPEDKKHEELGARGDTNVGVCATKALPLLRYAEVAGDPEAVAASVKALAYMDRFAVPAGAQLWECPLHAPDILASARAVAAYLAGYRITGNMRYIEKARYWASTGIPFVYFWSAPDRRIMKGASIPIFGATFFTLSWLGRPVQWNGLDYADALLDLARYDSSFDWRTLAKAITISAMNQQADAGENAGLYPDSWDLARDKAMDPWLNPAIIVNNLWDLQGKRWIETSILPGGQARITLPSGASWTAQSGDLRVLLKGEPLLGSEYVVVTRARRPASVTLKTGSAGAESFLPEVADLSRAESGWKFDAERSWLVVKSAGSRPAILKINGLLGTPKSQR